MNYFNSDFTLKLNINYIDIIIYNLKYIFLIHL